MEKGEPDSLSVSDLAKLLSRRFPDTETGKRLLFHLLYWLSDVEPFQSDVLARQLNCSPAQLQTAIEGFPRLEFDSKGRICGVGGLSLTPGEIRVELGQKALYAHSALDALIVPTFLLRRVRVFAHAADDRSPIELRFGFDQALAVDPTTALISVPGPESNVDESWKKGSLFFSNTDGAREWRWKNPAGAVVPVQKVFLAAALLRRALMS